MSVLFKVTYIDFYGQNAGWIIAVFFQESFKDVFNLFYDISYSITITANEARYHNA